jgi:hypothetical protein
MAERSADKMVEILKLDPGRLSKLKENPLQEISKLRDEAIGKVPVYYGDKWLYRMALAVLGTLAILTAVAVLVRGTVPEALVALGSTAIGALVGLFAPSPLEGKKK